MAKIMVVEDEDNIAIALDFLLSREGHEHTRLASGAGALDAIREARPDVVLLDIMLPDVSGYQILQDLRADPDLAGIRVLVMTARGAAARGLAWPSQLNWCGVTVVRWN